MLHPLKRIQKKPLQEIGAAPIWVDHRFRRLVAKADWEALPAAVRKRFSKRLTGGATSVYTGNVTGFRISRFGRFLAHALRIIGAPLPLLDHVNVPTVVTVTEDVKTSGQIWTRTYANRTGFPQVIHSVKLFGGPTGLEEHVGFGVTMLLKVVAEPRGLIFESAGYQLKLGRLRLSLPKFLTPGEVIVTHMETDSTHFIFEMTLRHPWMGELIQQTAEYRDVMQ
jgi:Domain of unknown function (DUF4166)